MHYLENRLHLRQLSSSLPSAQSLRRSHLLRDDIHWPSDWQVNSSDPQAEHIQTNMMLGIAKTNIKNSSDTHYRHQFQVHKIHAPTSYASQSHDVLKDTTDHNYPNQYNGLLSWLPLSPQQSPGSTFITTAVYVHSHDNCNCYHC